MAKRPSTPPAGRSDSESVRIRKIRNGYVTTRIGTREGKFFKTEEYSRKQPMVETKVAAKPAARAPAGNEVGYLNRGR